MLEIVKIKLSFKAYLKMSAREIIYIEYIKEENDSVHDDMGREIIPHPELCEEFWGIYK